MLVFLDTCCVIYAVENTTSLGDSVRAAVLAMPPGIQLATTELVRYECIVHPIRLKDDATLSEFADLFAGFVFLQLGRREYDTAAALRAMHKLSSLDALHLAAAITNGCAEFWTNDGRIDAAAIGATITVRNVVQP